MLMSEIKSRSLVFKAAPIYCVTNYIHPGHKLSSYKSILILFYYYNYY